MAAVQGEAWGGGGFGASGAGFRVGSVILWVRGGREIEVWVIWVLCFWGLELRV